MLTAPLTTFDWIAATTAISLTITLVVGLAGWLVGRAQRGRRGTRDGARR